MFEYEREAPDTPFLGWGRRAIRKASTKATSPTLLNYRSCIAGKMSGKDYDDLKDVQKSFKEAAHECKPS